MNKFMYGKEMQDLMQLGSSPYSYLTEKSNVAHTVTSNAMHVGHNHLLLSLWSSYLTSSCEDIACAMAEGHMADYAVPASAMAQLSLLSP